MTPESRIEPARRRGGALVRGTLPRQVTLALGVAGTTGGTLLLALNLATALATGVAALPWVPLAANASLIFGGAMFLREYRRRARGPSSPPTD